MQSLRQRVDVLGVNEPNFTIEEPNRIRVQLAGINDEEEARELLATSEKLHETLFHADERYRPTSHPKILQAEARAIQEERVFHAVDRMRASVAEYDLPALSQLLRDSVPEFSPQAAPREPEVATVVAFPARHARKT